MCDTLVALGNSTKNSKVIFAKNSDRNPDEPAEILHIPRTKHSAGSEVETTYISIPQVRETAEVLLCKPIWIWGAEMGANEFGVTIGNEAVFTKEKYVEAREAELRWIERIKNMPIKKKTGIFYKKKWEKLSKRNRLPLLD